MDADVALLLPAISFGDAVAGAARRRPSIFPNDRRLRGGKLQRIRQAYFRMFPLCVACLAKKPPEYRIATVLDHVVALENGGPDFDELGGESNRQGLCEECHKHKTRIDSGYRQDRPLPRAVGLDGFPLPGGSGDDAE